MSWATEVICMTTLILGAIACVSYVATNVAASPHDLPRINSPDIPYTPCGQQLIEVNMVTIGDAKCARLLYLDGSVNHVCDKDPKA